MCPRLILLWPQPISRQHLFAHEGHRMCVGYCSATMNGSILSLSVGIVLEVTLQFFPADTPLSPASNLLAR